MASILETMRCLYYLQPSDIIVEDVSLTNDRFLQQ